MPETKYTITIFTQAAGSNKGDLSGKLRFEDCTDMQIINSKAVGLINAGSNLMKMPVSLEFNYKSASTGKKNFARFALTSIVGYVVEEQSE